MYCSYSFGVVAPSTTTGSWGRISGLAVQQNYRPNWRKFIGPGVLDEPEAVAEFDPDNDDISNFTVHRDPLFWRANQLQFTTYSDGVFMSESSSTYVKLVSTQPHPTPPKSTQPYETVLNPIQPHSTPQPYTTPPTLATSYSSLIMILNLFRGAFQGAVL